MSHQIPTLHLDRVVNEYAQDMSGKTVVITGTTSGTGYVCARECAKKGARVILLNRNSERSKKALDNLQSEVPNASFELISCDLQDFDSVRNATASIKSKYNSIDVLVNNAGVMAMKDIATKNGYDVQMQTNVLSHFLITKELFPLLRKSKDARIVNHSSQARLGPPLEARYFEANGGDLGGEGTEEEQASFKGPRWARYHQTKLANACFTYGLKQKLEKANIDNVKALLAHPGLARTQLQITTAADGGMDANSDFMLQAQSAEDGATGVIRGAMDPNAQSGDFYGPVEGWRGFPERLEPEEHLYETSNLEINWTGCEKAVGEFLIQ